MNISLLNSRCVSTRKSPQEHGSRFCIQKVIVVVSWATVSRLQTVIFRVKSHVPFYIRHVLGDASRRVPTYFFGIFHWLSFFSGWSRLTGSLWKDMASFSRNDSLCIVSALDLRITTEKGEANDNFGTFPLCCWRIQLEQNPIRLVPQGTVADLHPILTDCGRVWAWSNGEWILRPDS